MPETDRSVIAIDLISKLVDGLDDRSKEIGLVVETIRGIASELEELAGWFKLPWKT